ncbi:tripartite tricarboxylate transporter TctB family protein [Psychromarinibacter sp. C21-152]|uniref:Tripartite tricarboxylate transporter TctB family protein n=1 Tax=Psychromarinibacter sediminicola TaxID=3033385 RepID=A0AAE3T8V7_9RHOB|nr:tripartite tricarboxylate transporter TctB family protein [Psychromarinibacter sediminicola]MDF0600444.1 tripartite tricarboxylate transporter TctB family protein [Psychromarinibacter sediminicola]
MTIDRLLGGIFALFGIFLLAYAIPANVQTVPGLLVFPNPALFPQIAAGLLILLGVLQMVLVKTRSELPGGKKLGLFAAAAAATLVAMLLIDELSYLPVSIGLMAAVCLITGERRPLWLGVVIVVLPVGTWLLFEQVLQRPLP